MGREGDVGLENSWESFYMFYDNYVVKINLFFSDIVYLWFTCVVFISRNTI